MTGNHCNKTLRARPKWPLEARPIKRRNNLSSRAQPAQELMRSLKWSPIRYEYIAFALR